MNEILTKLKVTMHKLSRKGHLYINAPVNVNLWAYKTEDIDKDDVFFIIPWFEHEAYIKPGLMTRPCQALALNHYKVVFVIVFLDPGRSPPTAGIQVEASVLTSDPQRCPLLAGLGTTSGVRITLSSAMHAIFQGWGGKAVPLASLE